jgi:hypothetical protein
MHWAERYVGMPYADANCAELAVMVRRDVFDHDISLPSAVDGGVFALSEQIASHQGDFAERTINPVEGDAVLMRSCGRLNHIGVYCVISGQAWVLHAIKNAGQTALHRIADLEKINISIEGFYRWL